jgi:hypothetical protein
MKQLYVNDYWSVYTMQIDFHYDVIYVLARYAGFNRDDANTIAHSSQYVDDAEHGGIIKFTNHLPYYHIRTAHNICGEENKVVTANFNTWVPFHFLPGNISDGKKETSYTSRLACKANSNLANEMMCECINHKNNINGLHRLGICLHVYADTWAHQNFSGISDKINCTKKIKVNDKAKPIQEISRDLINCVLNTFLDNYLPLGHGTVQSYPDIPFIKWSYTDYLGEVHNINNYDRYIEAADEIYKYLMRFKYGNPYKKADSLPAEARHKILELFKNIHGNKSERHHKWQDKINEGYFCKEDKPYSYIASGKNSWKSIALKSDILNDDYYYTVDESFDNSDWKKFHDAAKEHLNFVINNLLPEYKIIS